MILGTVVKITSSIVCEVAIDSASIDVWDTDGTQVVTAQAMTADGGSGTELDPYIYYYIYQSDIADDPGNYKVEITAVSGAYTAISRSSFVLTE